MVKGIISQPEMLKLEFFAFYSNINPKMWNLEYSIKPCSNVFILINSKVSKLKLKLHQNCIFPSLSSFWDAYKLKYFLNISNNYCRNIIITSNDNHEKESSGCSSIYYIYFNRGTMLFPMLFFWKDISIVCW